MPHDRYDNIVIRGSAPSTSSSGGGDHVSLPTCFTNRYACVHSTNAFHQCVHTTNTLVINCVYSTDTFHQCVYSTDTFHQCVYSTNTHFIQRVHSNSTHFLRCVHSTNTHFIKCVSLPTCFTNRYACVHSTYAFHQLCSYH